MHALVNVSQFSSISKKKNYAYFYQTFLFFTIYKLNIGPTLIFKMKNSHFLRAFYINFLQPFSYKRNIKGEICGNFFWFTRNINQNLFPGTATSLSPAYTIRFSWSSNSLPAAYMITSKSHLMEPAAVIKTADFSFYTDVAIIQFFVSSTRNFATFFQTTNRQFVCSYSLISLSTINPKEQRILKTQHITRYIDLIVNRPNPLFLTYQKKKYRVS